MPRNVRMRNSVCNPDGRWKDLPAWEMRSFQLESGSAGRLTHLSFLAVASLLYFFTLRHWKFPHLIDQLWVFKQVLGNRKKKFLSHRFDASLQWWWPHLPTGLYINRRGRKWSRLVKHHTQSTLTWWLDSAAASSVGFHDGAAIYSGSPVPTPLRSARKGTSKWRAFAGISCF